MTNFHLCPVCHHYPPYPSQILDWHVAGMQYVLQEWFGRECSDSITHRFFCAPQIGADGPLSAEEQMYILYEIKLQCYQNLSNIEPASTGKTCAGTKKGAKHGTAVFKCEALQAYSTFLELLKHHWTDIQYVYMLPKKKYHFSLSRVSLKCPYKD